MKRLLRQRAALRWLSAIALALASLAVLQPIAAHAAPTNDNFVDATVIANLPFSDTVDTTTATTELGEPQGCYSIAQTVWYAFTPATNGTISASASGFFYSGVAAYTGTSLTSLTDLGCGDYGNLVTIQANAGQTYYFQVGGLYGESGSLTFNLVVTPPPTAGFSFYPQDPSSFDTVQFYDTSYDPGGFGIQSCAWSFGDGATATGCYYSYATHSYATDKDYTVQETVTTSDGRSASTSQVLHVRTHDVAITQFSVPNTARAGQTKSITVGVSSRRYPELVEVSLSKSVPGGFQQVGTLGPYTVPVLKAKGTVPFTFSYTFTSADAAIGKVTFQATATISGARDALPADNTAVSLPTTVTR
jgi:PKD repeat protein